MFKKILYTLLIIFLGIQFIPVDRTKPKADKAMEIVDGEVKEILKKACFDCHSNETLWPWYSYIAPISWEIAEHVEHGRKELNFSIFGKYTLKRKIKKMDEAIDEIDDGKMPLEEYIRFHPEAELSQSDKDRLLRWFKGKKEQYKIEMDSLKQ